MVILTKYIYKEDKGLGVGKVVVGLMDYWGFHLKN